jgi:hypothetical protein
MSHHKCFYCERGLTRREQEVDHYVEVSARRDLAFAWDNLYLCCPDCNSQKAPDAQVACADCVDPCSPTQPPSDHLGFADECIFPRNDRGRHTVRKYRLDRDALDLKRSRESFSRATATCSPTPCARVAAPSPSARKTSSGATATPRCPSP